MRIKGRELTFNQIFFLSIYYSFAIYFPFKIGKYIRWWCCKHIFKKIGNNVNIERRAIFGCGIDIEIGNNSGIGIRASIPSDTIIGENVMMGPCCIILPKNHSYSRIDIPIIQQGYDQRKVTIIEDDVWIGRNVIMTPGRKIKKGTIIAAGTVLCKDFPAFSIIGGNPSKLIKNRLL